MDEFIAKLLSAILSEAGLVAMLLALALWYQTNELKIVRKDNNRLHDQVLQLATKSISTMKELQGTLEKIVLKGGKKSAEEN